MAVPTATPQTVTIHIMATTATDPLLHELAAAYERPGTLLAISSAVADWTTISERLLSGETSFALTTYLPADSKLWAAPIGQDGIAIITDTANQISLLTVDELRRIFRGQVTTWAEVGSAAGGANIPVTVVSREDGADTRFVFEALVMDSHPITPGARLALSSESMVEIVTSTPGAIGYVSMGWVQSAGDQVRIVPILDEARSDVPRIPTAQALSEGLYPLRAPILIVGLQPPEAGTASYDWFAWMQSEPGQQILGQRYGTLLP
jgi:phosphate transport system substrate-binding protein